MSCLEVWSGKKKFLTRARTFHRGHLCMRSNMFKPMQERIGVQIHPNISQLYLVGGFNPSEKYEFVNWDDEIPNIWENKIHVPNHQPGNRNPRYLPHYDTTQGQLQEHMALSTVAWGNMYWATVLIPDPEGGSSDHRHCCWPFKLKFIEPCFGTMIANLLFCVII